MPDAVKRNIPWATVKREITGLQEPGRLHSGCFFNPADGSQVKSMKGVPEQDPQPWFFLFPENIFPV